MKILFITQYFPPEVGAPQNRLHELAVRLREKGAEITVLTAMPNYPDMKIYDGYKGKWYSYELKESIKIHRCYIYVPPKRTFFLRLLNYFSFVVSSLLIGMVKIKKSDFIICESPPLFLGISAYLLKKFKRAKLIFNVSDLWPESAEKLGLVKNRFLLGMSVQLEEFLYQKSTLITAQTQGIVKNISSRFPMKKVYWLPNGADISLFNSGNAKSNWRNENNFSDKDFILLYAGIIGHAQGIEVILKAAEQLKNTLDIKFVLLGNGPEKEKLYNMKNELKISNIFFLNSVSKNKMPEILSQITAAIIPLKKIDLFKGAIPSKIFENLAMKKPILLGVEGEAKELFIDEGKCGLAFEPGNSNDLAEKILQLYYSPEMVHELGENGFRYVYQKFNRSNIADDFWNCIIQ